MCNGHSNAITFQVLKDLKESTRKQPMDKASAVKRLQDAGILDEEGELEKIYRD